MAEPEAIPTETPTSIPEVPGAPGQIEPEVSETPPAPGGEEQVPDAGKAEEPDGAEPEKSAVDQLLEKLSELGKPAAETQKPAASEPTEDEMFSREWAFLSKNDPRFVRSIQRIRAKFEAGKIDEDEKNDLERDVFEERVERWEEKIERERDKGERARVELVDNALAADGIKADSPEAEAIFRNAAECGYDLRNPHILAALAKNPALARTILAGSKVLTAGNGTAKPGTSARRPSATPPKPPQILAPGAPAVGGGAYKPGEGDFSALVNRLKAETQT